LDSGVLGIADNGVTNDKLSEFARICRSLGRPLNSVGDPQDMVAGRMGAFLQRDATC
jgi:hypothetical protein